MPNQLIISSYPISQDTEGRFCLNDLHKAAGNKPKHQPDRWLRLNQTKELIDEVAKSLNLADTHIPVSEKINNLEPVKIVKGFSEKQGTYVVKPLVYSYAMWISPVFHLHVINAYDVMINGQIPENIVRAYEILVENLPYVKPLAEAISLAEYETRKQALLQGLHDLNHAKILMTGAELEAFRKSQSV